MTTLPPRRGPPALTLCHSRTGNAFPAHFGSVDSVLPYKLHKKDSFQVIKDKVHSFLKHFLSTYYVLGSEDTTMSQLRVLVALRQPAGLGET